MRKILFTCLIFSSSAFADKLPYNREFPRAQYPYAKGEDGCSSWDSDHPEYVPDRFFFASFANACDHHDWCYYTLGTTADECNDEFKSRLYATCERDFATAALCRTAATTYWAIVVEAAPSVFAAAQRMQARYVDYGNRVLAERFERLIGRAISEQELEHGRAFLLTGSLDAWERSYLAWTFGPEIVRTVFAEVTGEAAPDGEIPRLVDMLVVYGKVGLTNEIINKNATAIVRKIWSEERGGPLSPLRQAYFRNILISTHDVHHLRNIIKNT